MAVVPIAVFARAPRPGEVKTRLVRALGRNGAAALYAGFLEDTLTKCISEDTTVWTVGAPDDPALASLLGGVPARAQRGSDLGARMADALGALLARAGAGILVGSDAPTLPPSYLGLAGQALSDCDAVLGPAADGGYYLVGAKHRVPRIFEGIRWSTPRVLDETLLRATAEGLRVALLPPWYDVDTPEDLRLLRAHLSLRPDAAPATARALGL